MVGIVRPRGLRTTADGMRVQDITTAALDYCALMFASAISFAHFSDSARMYAAN